MTIKLPENRPSRSTRLDKELLQFVSPMSHYFTDNVIVMKSTGLDSRNQPTYEEYRNIPCRYEPTDERKVSENGEMVLCSGFVYMDIHPVVVEIPLDYIILRDIKYNPVTVEFPRHVRWSYQKVYIK